MCPSPAAWTISRLRRRIALAPRADLRPRWRCTRTWLMRPAPRPSSKLGDEPLGGERVLARCGSRPARRGRCRSIAASIAFIVLMLERAASTGSSRNGNWSSRIGSVQPIWRSARKNSSVSIRWIEPTGRSSSHSRQLSLTSTVNSRPWSLTRCSTSAGVSLANSEWPRSTTMPMSSRADLRDAHQRPRRGREADVHPRLLGLVLDRHADVVVHRRDRAHAVEREPPQLAVVRLQRVGRNPSWPGHSLTVGAPSCFADADRLLAQLERLRCAPPGPGW